MAVTRSQPLRTGPSGVRLPPLLSRLYPYTAYIELAGIVLGVVGAVTDLVLTDTEFASTVGYLGVAVFAVGLLLQLSSLPSAIREELGALETKLSSVPGTVQEELATFDDRLADVVDAMSGLERVVHDLESVVYLPTIQEVAAERKDPKTSQIINRVVRSEVWNDVVAAIGAYREVAEGTKGYAEFKQPAQTYSGMLAVLDSLGDGSSWFGVTRIQDVDAWDPRWLPAWDDYQQRLKTRLRDGSLEVFRVYSIDSEPTEAQMDFYRREARTGMVVKYLVGNADDITAIYEPAEQPTGPSPLADKLKDLQSGHNLHAELVRSGYEPLFGLDFFVDRSVLWRLHLHTDNGEIQSRATSFARAWLDPQAVLVTPD